MTKNGAGREQTLMKHPASRELYAYWQELRGHRPAPERNEIEPGAIRQILSEAFILALDRADYPFRLAGTRLCGLFARELKGQSFIGLWDEPSRRAILDLLAVLTDEWVGTVAGVTAHNASGELVELELLLLPLSSSRPCLARTIGVLAPLKMPQWIGVSPIGGLSLGSRRHVGAAVEKRLLPKFLSPRNRRGFVVYDGGQS
ncbi:MAG: PAS domain-containing protein [Xanthobacteraceae bacterium]